MNNRILSQLNIFFKQEFVRCGNLIYFICEMFGCEAYSSGEVCVPDKLLVFGINATLSTRKNDTFEFVLDI